ncbi:hypothetical protein GE09DRAFT_766920 [Coniochaeta sp. 2T2.1]|nr:hypothetical protein GE09DRAFT_766920 [Coniochaeta sp. 2T2.1]
MAPDGSSRSRTIYRSDKEPEQDITFDQRGDLQLIVNDYHTFTVCSRALARASPVFDRMLYGGFSETKPLEGEWIVNLSETAVYRLVILLDIAHGNVHNIRKDIDKHLAWFRLADACGLLCEVAMAADYYDMVKVFWPWADSWLARCKKRDGGCNVPLIWAAWVLGDETTLLRRLDDAVLSLYLLPNEDYCSQQIEYRAEDGRCRGR